MVVRLNLVILVLQVATNWWFGGLLAWLLTP